MARVRASLHSAVPDPRVRASLHSAVPEKRLTETFPAPSSALSQFFASFSGKSDPEARVDASLAPFTDVAIRSLHRTSEELLPSAKRLSEGVSQSDRFEMLVWLTHTFEIMRFPDTAFFSTVLLLDRYYASSPQADACGAEAQQRLLAAICVAVKTGSREDVNLPLRHLVSYLGRDKVPFKKVVDAELAMLRPLRFCASSPTPHCFLETLSLRTSGCDPRCKHLAEFLLELSLAEIELHYGYPSSILAAAALILAFFATRAPAELYITILEDLALTQQDDAAAAALSCASGMHKLWRAAADPDGESGANSFIQQVLSKFSRSSLYSVAALQVPVVAPVSLPPHREVHDALCLVQKCLAAPGKSEDVGKAVLMQGRQQREDDAPNLPHKIEELEARCGLQIEMPHDWCASLARELQAPALKSSKVRRILMLHGWEPSCFRQIPDRHELFQDLVRAAQAAPFARSPTVSSKDGDNSIPGGSHHCLRSASSLDLRSSSATTRISGTTQAIRQSSRRHSLDSSACSVPQVGGGCGGFLGIGNRRRSTSWCKQRTSCLRGNAAIAAAEISLKRLLS